MKSKLTLLFTLFLFVFSPLVFSQSKGTGAISGTVKDEENTRLPGVAVTLSSENLMGDRSAITDPDGHYRFPALPPGLYTVTAQLQGFATVIRENIRVTTTVRLTVDLGMKLSSIEEEVTVYAVSPTIDVKTSETASVTLSNELLRAMPTTQFVTGIVNLAPGVNNDVAYGSSDGTGISYQVDGVDVSDPELGSAWVFLDYNVLEEVKVMGLGLNAEYGAFTGVIFNTITKSGGNEFAGHAEFIFQDTKKGFWTSENNGEYIEDFPDLESPIYGMTDGSFHLGGPIMKDKLWFFVGLQYYRSKQRPAGFEAPNFRDYKQPRLFTKLTSQLGSMFNLTAFLELDRYNGINRRAGVTHPTPETCVSQTSPEIVGNFNLTTILSQTTFIDLKASFFDGYYYLDPQGGGTATWSTEDWQWYDNSNWWYKADRKRFQANAAISHYAEDFIQGNHDFKFGTEFEYGEARSQFGYTGPNSWYIYDWYGYLYAYQYEGYDLDSHYTRTEVFAQDAWSITDNLTLNFGGRFSLMKGGVEGISGSVYTANRFAPRAGIAWDIFGDHKTVFKAHYGQYTEAMFTGVFDRLNTADSWSDYVGYSQWGGVWYEDWRDVHYAVTLADNIKHPYMDQFTLGIEREFFKDASFGVTYIKRKWKNMLGIYDTVAVYEEEIVNDPITNATYTVYNSTNPGEHQYVMGNVGAGDPYIALDLFRDYQGIEVLFNKRFSNRWQLLASYVYSVTKGTMDNGFGDDVGWGGSVEDPNFWINREGRATNDPTHMLKLQGSYILPFNIHFNAYFKYITGNTYTRRARFRLDQGRRTINTEEKGSRRYDSQTNLDLRLEKTFIIADRFRIGLMMDIFNVFNDDTITSWGTLVGSSWNPGDPSEPGPDGHEVFGLVNPRAFRLGIRLFF